MFILHGIDSFGEVRYTIGYSEDKDELQAMIVAFNKATHCSDGANLSFDSCPEEIKFGSILLKKNCGGARYYSTDNSSVEQIVICYNDRLFIVEANHISNPNQMFLS